MGQRHFLFWTLAALAILLLWHRPAEAPRAPATGKSALILYQNGPFDSTELHATLTANLFGRLGRARIADLDDYRTGGLEGVDALFVLPVLGGQAPGPALLADIRRMEAEGDRTIFWMQDGIDALFADPGFARAQGWRPGPPRLSDHDGVRYAGTRFGRDPRSRVLIRDVLIDDPSRVRTLATLIGGTGAGRPFAVQAGRLVYLPERPFPYASEDDRYLVFADLLVTLIAPATPARRRALVRIEDVGPEADPARIRAVADLLHSLGAPFSMTVYDTYRDPDGHYSGGRPLRISLRQRSALVRALRYAEAQGGTLVAHGHTHQADIRPNPYVRVSGGDYEFFAADLAEGQFDLKGPLPDDSVAEWRARLDRSARAWRRADLPFPRLFTTPHYAGSLNAYRAMAGRFDARYERVLYFAGEGAGGPPRFEEGSETQLFPYPVVDHRGHFIIPENLGYASSTRQGGHFGRDSARLIATARRNLALRDAHASFFHHWYEDPAALRNTVTGLQALGYRFVSPAEIVAEAPAYMRRHAVPAPAPTAVARPSPWLILLLSTLMALLIRWGFRPGRQTVRA